MSIYDIVKALFIDTRYAFLLNSTIKHCSAVISVATLLFYFQEANSSKKPLITSLSITLENCPEQQAIVLSLLGCPKGKHVQKLCKTFDIFTFQAIKWLSEVIQ